MEEAIQLGRQHQVKIQESEAYIVYIGNRNLLGTAHTELCLHLLYHTFFRHGEHSFSRR